ncbi:cytochrome bc complex cytochrome b subunit [Rickettsiella endosymbiont of Litargus connexus]|uniref:cytochrome b n=1 Tax=Rickettsiella endosymbiont of Litargus connexus TaxID=3066237 RepID=UPI0027E97C0A|nr:ubiquinol-cytochrome c reductase cytochrome b subunit [Pseudomonadota bacterium]
MNGNTDKNSGKNSIFNWLSERLPINEYIHQHLTQYYLPKNLNFWYFFGSLSLFTFFLQILTGIWLTLFYTPTPAEAFNSIEIMMREVPYGWLLRYLHSTGASVFFILIYAHIFRSLLYGSYKKPRELVWLLGVCLYIILLLEAFLGYLLPWGQTSYWASQIGTSLLESIPKVGQTLTLWIRGNTIVSAETLHRFFALHVIAMPLSLVFLIRLHLIALHKVGCNNPEGISISTKSILPNKTFSRVPFHPYYTVKELYALLIFLFIFSIIVFFVPEMNGYFLEANNFIPADPLLTPSHIKPLWYLAPFYGVLCVIPNKSLGILVMGAFLFMLFMLPWLDLSPVRSMRYRGCYSRFALAIFILSFGLLTYMSTTLLTPDKTLFVQILLLNYFLFFLLMPFYTKYEKNKLLPRPLCGK